MPKRKTKEEFIADAIRVHGDKYDYSKSVYINNKTPVTIICHEHGEFTMRPDSHIGLKQGCPKCGYSELGKSKRLDNEEFIKKAKEVHGDKYDYSEVDYKTTDTPVTIICPIHGAFKQAPHNHIGQKQGCPKCSRRYMDKEYFIELSKKIHGDKYDYSKVVYKNARTPVTIICPVHGEFRMRPNDHLNGHGCGKCYNSKLEDEVELVLKNEGINYVTQKTYDDLKDKNKLRYDFYLPEYNVLVECQGEQHYMPVKRSNSESKKKVLERYEENKRRDKLKFDYATEHNIPLLYYTHFKKCNEGDITSMDVLLGKIFDNRKK